MRLEFVVLELWKREGWCECTRSFADSLDDEHSGPEADNVKEIWNGNAHINAVASMMIKKVESDISS